MKPEKLEKRGYKVLRGREVCGNQIPKSRSNSILTSKLGKWKSMFEFKFFRAVRGSFLLATSVCTYSGTFWKANPVRENGLFIVFLCIYCKFPSKLLKPSLTSILVSDFHRLPDLGGLCNRVFRVSRLSKNLYTNFHTKFPSKL